LPFHKKDYGQSGQKISGGEKKNSTAGEVIFQHGAPTMVSRVK